MADKVRCPKCGKKFKDNRGLPAHAKTCDGTAEPAKPGKAAKARATPKAPKAARLARRLRSRMVKDPAHPALNGSAVVERLLAVKKELEVKAASLGRMAEELSSI